MLKITGEIELDSTWCKTTNSRSHAARPVGLEKHGSTKGSHPFLERPVLTRPFLKNSLCSSLVVLKCPGNPQSPLFPLPQQINNSHGPNSGTFASQTLRRKACRSWACSACPARTFLSSNCSKGPLGNCLLWTLTQTSSHTSRKRQNSRTPKK